MKCACFLMFTFHELRDLQWSADTKQKSTQKLTCSPAILPSFFHTQKRGGEGSLQSAQWGLTTDQTVQTCLLWLLHALQVRGLPYLPPTKGVFRISVEMSDDYKDLHFQTIQISASFSFWEDVWKLTDWNLHLWATWQELARFVFQTESPI